MLGSDRHARHPQPVDLDAIVERARVAHQPVRLSKSETTALVRSAVELHNQLQLVEARLALSREQCVHLRAEADEWRGRHARLVDVLASWAHVTIAT